MTLLESILGRYGPLMGYPEIADLFGYRGDAASSTMRQRLRRDKQLGESLRAATLQLGRRVYFRSDMVAAAIESQTEPAAPLPAEKAAPALDVLLPKPLG